MLLCFSEEAQTAPFHLHIRQTRGGYITLYVGGFRGIVLNGASVVECGAALDELLKFGMHNEQYKPDDDGESKANEVSPFIKWQFRARLDSSA